MLWDTAGSTSPPQTVDGAVLQGQDLTLSDAATEYEYALTVNATDVPAMTAALDGVDTDDPLHRLAQHANQLVDEDVVSWLRRHGTPFAFWSRANHSD